MSNLTRGIKDVFEQFRTVEFWIAIMLIIFFSTLTYLLIYFAFMTDSILVDTRGARCRPMDNTSIIFLFFSITFFAFSAVLMLGELQRYIDMKAQGAIRESSGALINGVIWGFVSTAIASGILIFFNTICI